MVVRMQVFRDVLNEIFDVIRDRYAECLEIAQADGQIAPDLDARQLAEFCLSSWQGAILRAKTVRSVEPIRIFIKILFGYVLQAPAKALQSPEVARRSGP